MKTYPSFIALILAVAIHVAVISLVWLSLNNTSETKPLIHEKRFGVTFAEEDEFLPTPVEPPKSAAVKIRPSPFYNRKIPERSFEKPLIDDSSANIEVQEKLPRYTQEQRDTLPPSVLHHYGEEFFALSAGEQHYIIDNLQRIRKINEIVGTRLLRERPDDEIDPDDSNVVEFYLNPDGTISDLHLQKNRIGTALDELTLQTITLAHTKYPKPEQKTLIRIRVYIIIK